MNAPESGRQPVGMGPFDVHSEILKNYVGGCWIDAERSGALPVENPSTGAILGQVPLSTPTEVERAVATAASAFTSWSRTPASRRAEYLFGLLERLRANEEVLARSITEENGKSLPDARAEMKRLIENCEVATGMPVLQQGDKLVGASDGIDGEVIRLPLGVFAMAGPFNFPGMVPFWFLPYAIGAGNTFVLKPSEQTPLTMQRIAGLIHDAGLPAGVFNLVHGDRTVVETLIANPRVKGLSLVGSSRTARLIAEQCARAGKRFQAMGGAKNHLVVMPDAHVDEAVRNMVSSCFGCAGQRCMAASAIVAVGDDVHRQVCEQLVEASRRVVVANPLDPAMAGESMLVGPVISAKAKAFIHEMIATGVREGARLLVDGRSVVVPGCEKGHFIGPTIFADVQPGMSIHRTEIFGPVVVVLKAGSFDEAVKIINDHEYGNGASIYTQSGYWARRFKLEVECGMIGINVGIPAPVAHLPFGGMKASQLSDIKAQGRAVIHFFTEAKVITERYWPE
ncbi:MAG: CoA-acylating methylmalonate-semialdehyde dehydrogenase [Verrucomicrobiales bacterium]|nr:CoA-acylating methylmalonate-semialdehyde dehydrogenase [Verrucomicrobiales bacterium]